MIFCYRYKHYFLRNYFSFALILYTLFFLGVELLESKQSPVTEKAVAHFSQLDSEIFYGSSLSESLLRCSFLQDAWVAYLYDAENQQEFLSGMASIDEVTPRFKSMMAYVSNPDILNFFNPGDPQTLFPQIVKIESENDSFDVYLNTFKTGKNLNSIDRERYFHEELTKYREEGIETPFDLNEKTLQLLSSRSLYNFVMFPDGTIRLALEKPGGKDYQLMNEQGISDFAYPNHSILAGSPHQPLLTAGTLMLFRDREKQLIFISPKSGHFVPSFSSLACMKQRLIEFGLDDKVIISVPTVDLAEVVLKAYHTSQIPISIADRDIPILFYLAHARWVNSLNNIDFDFIESLSRGDQSVITSSKIRNLNTLREEATYMRSAYRLFSEDHVAPAYFHKFVKKFGRLKDAIKHNVKQSIIDEASWLVEFFDKHQDLLRNHLILFAKDQDFFDFLKQEILETKNLLTKEVLRIEEFHTVKKNSRELATLLMLLSDEYQSKGKYFFIYRAANKQFFLINQMLANIHDEQVGKLMLGEVDKSDVILKVPEHIHHKLFNILNQLSIDSPSLNLAIMEEAAFWMINSAKEWYQTHSKISGHPTGDNSNQYHCGPHKLLTSIVNENLVEFGDKEKEALNLLKLLKRQLEIARNALVFLDLIHEAPIDLQEYLNCLEVTIHAVIEKTGTAVDEAAKLIKYLENKSVPSNALEHWTYTDPDSFRDTLRCYLSCLNYFQQSSVPADKIQLICSNMQAIADLMTLNLKINKQYRALPTISYETIIKECESLIAEISFQKMSQSQDLMPITKKMKQNAEYLLKKFSNYL